MKRKEWKIIWRVLLVCVMVACLLPTLAQTTSAATNKISGTVNASQIPNNCDVELTGDTTIILDRDLVLCSISGGDYALTVQGNHTLTVNNTTTAIKVRTLNVSSKLVAQVSKSGYALDVQGPVEIDSNYLYISGGIQSKGHVKITSIDATVVGVDYGIRSSDAIELSGNIGIGAHSTALLTASYIRLAGNITCNTVKDLTYTIIAEENIYSVNGRPVNLTVRGSSCIVSQSGNIDLTGQNIDVQSNNGFAVIANNGSVKITAEKLTAICSGGREGEVYTPYGVSGKTGVHLTVTELCSIAGRDYGVHSEEGSITLDGGGSYYIGAMGNKYNGNCCGIYAPCGDIKLEGDFRVISDEGGAVYAPSGSVIVTGSLNADASGGDVVFASKSFTFNGTTLKGKGHRGIASQEITIKAEKTSVIVEYLSAIDAAQSFSTGSVYIDSDSLYLETAAKATDPMSGKYGIYAKNDVTVVSDAATIMGKVGISAGESITLRGDFSVVGSEGAAIRTSKGNLNVEGGLSFHSFSSGREKVYSIAAKNFTFTGATLSGSGNGGIYAEDGAISISAKSVNIETNYLYALHGVSISVDSDQVRLVELGTNEEMNETKLYCGALDFRSKLTMNVTDAYISGSTGITGHQQNSVATLNGSFTVVGTQSNAISVYNVLTVNGSLTARSEGAYDDDTYRGATMFVDKFTFSGTTLAVEGVNIGIRADAGILDITAENFIVLSEQTTALYAKALQMNVQRATIRGKTGIQIGKDGSLHISGNNIGIEATGTNSSGIWCQSPMALEGNITIQTNGWYGINAEKNLTISKGYYKITGPKGNAQAVLVGGSLTVDRSLKVLEPAGGHIYGNEIRGAGDSPAMNLLMYTPVDKVDILLSTPSDGMLPIRDSAAIYGLPAQCSFGSIKWYENGAEMESGDRFTAGKTYTAEIILVADEGYYFAEGVLATVNGKGSSMTGTMDGRTKLMIRVDLGKCTTAITWISLNIAAPVDGSKPSTAVTTPSDSHYGVRSSNVQWLVSNDGINYTAMASGAKFVGGKFYRVAMDVTLSNSNYAFKITTRDGSLQSDVLAFVNGAFGQVSKAYDQDPETVITVTFDFGKCNDAYIEDITIVDVVAPVAGEYPSYNVNMFGTGYKVDTNKNSYYDAYWAGEKWYYVKNGVQWWDVTTGSWEYVYENNQFISGHQYVCQVYLVTESGYEFVTYSSLNATINGEEAEINEGWTTGWEARVYATFTCKAKLITTIMIDGIDAPQTGKTPDYTASVAYPEYYQLDTSFGYGGIHWYTCEYGSLTPQETFGDASPYRIAVRFISTTLEDLPLAEFASNVKVYVNGKEIVPDGRWDNVTVHRNVVMAYFTFRNAASAPDAEMSIYSFTQQPQGGALKPGQAHNITWQTSFVPTKTEIQYWDGAAWKQWGVPASQGQYTLESKEAATRRFRIVAYIGQQLVATSNEFTVAWESEAHVHTESDWLSDGWSHWKECTVCHEVTQSSGFHTGGVATCQEKAKCRICGALYGEKASHVLDISLWGFIDATGHARMCIFPGCNHCGAVEPHRSSGPATEDTDEYCLDCGYVINKALNHVHAPLDGYRTDADSHWTLCGCGEILEKAAHCDTDGDNVCDVCGYMLPVNYPDDPAPTDPPPTQKPDDDPGDSTNPTDPDDPSAPTDEKPGSNGGSGQSGGEEKDSGLWLILVAVIVLAAGAAAVVLWKKKK